MIVSLKIQKHTSILSVNYNIVIWCLTASLNDFYLILGGSRASSGLCRDEGGRWWLHESFGMETCLVCTQESKVSSNECCTVKRSQRYR